MDYTNSSIRLPINPPLTFEIKVFTHQGKAVDFNVMPPYSHLPPLKRLAIPIWVAIEPAPPTIAVEFFPGAFGV